MRRAVLVAALLALSACDSAETPPGETPETPPEILAQLSPQQRGLPGRWRKLQEPSPDVAEKIRELESIGYLAGSKPATGLEGVVQHDPEKASAGLNFYTSGHAPAAILVDMEGEPLHTWRLSYDRAFPDDPLEERIIGAEYWRKAHLYENGDVVAVYEGLGIVRVDADSRLVWANRNHAHHDFDVAPNGDLYVLTRTAHVVERVSPRTPILEDFLSVLDPGTGEEKRRLSILECFDRADSADSWKAAYTTFWAKEHDRRLSGSDPSDVFHTNAVQILDGSGADALPELAAGNVLLSMRNLDTIAILDMKEERIVWTSSGELTLQHEPVFTSTGSILVFDNHWRPKQWSRIAAIDPATGTVTSVWEGSPENPFYSHSCGTVSALAGGNVLVTESDNGRAFELSPDGEIVWEFYNPFRAGDHEEYVATLFEVIRLPLDFPTGWATAP